MLGPPPVLTPMQQQVYDYLISFVQDNGYPPLLVEIQKHFGYRSKNSAKQILEALETRRYIVLDGTPRGIAFTRLKITLEASNV